jgi:excisionase family DNA binding protein
VANAALMSDLLSVKQVADLFGISKDTVLRAIQRGDLVAEFEQGPTGAQYLTSDRAAHEWWERRKIRVRRKIDQNDTVSKVDDLFGEDEPPQAAQEIFESAAVAAHQFIPDQPEPVKESQATQDNFEYAPHAVQVYTQLAAPASVPMEVHLQALRLVERAQIQMDSLSMELNSSRRMLSEQAQSLAEKSAMQAEIAALKEENERRLSMWEREKAELSEHLSTSKTRVDWLEKRVPRWLRRMCGA